MDLVILGGGLAGLSFAYFLEQPSIILEREEELGGLCRSFDLNGITYDIGPHILFSKNKDILNKLISLIETNQIKRSNKIFHKGRLLKYPFENGLAGLNKNEKDYCLQEFLDNPYKTYEPRNMLQSFLQRFGEGITNLYLKPYNEKIWKFDPTYMDTQMVERIPKPTDLDIINSAKGIETEGYLHQLYFHYPARGGIRQLIRAYNGLISHKAKIIHPITIKKIVKNNGVWTVRTNKGDFDSGILINTLPLHELFRYLDAPKNIRKSVGCLRYNSLYCIVLQAKKDGVGNNFAMYFADKNTIFHRISKLNFLGENYCLVEGASTILVEITYRPNSLLARFDSERIKQKVINDLDELDLVKKEDILDIVLKKFKYAYVIYDLDHRKNTDIVLSYLSSIGILCCGRFAEFEYLNMDNVVDHSYKLAEKLNLKRANETN